MKAAIVNPYWDTLGGGERYCMGVAKVLVDKGYSVDIEWEDSSILGKITERFNISIDGLKVVKSISRGRGYDVCFWLSDGSIPILYARNNILHFQTPFTGVSGRSLLNKLKFSRINHVVINSVFTKKYIDREYGVRARVLYPPVSTEMFMPAKVKRNIILAVGRFSQLQQSKNQHVLIEVYKKMVDRGLAGWKLVLAGGIEIGSDEYLKKLKTSIQNYPIEIIESPSFSKLQKLYSNAKIFWSASGFGINEEVNPKMVEHFGITTIEAMSAGCVPVVHNSGGSKEILDFSGKNYLWDTRDQLIKRTENIIENYAKIDIADFIQRSEDYSQSKFEQNFSNIL